MTSLTETLPILDEAVPALPGKVEAVARTADELHHAAEEALVALRNQRAEGEALVAQIREALESVREQADAQERRVADLMGELQPAVATEARGVEQDADGLRDAGTQAAVALGELEAVLVQAGDRTEAAHDDAREAVSALAVHTGTAGTSWLPRPA